MSSVMLVRIRYQLVFNFDLDMNSEWIWFCRINLGTIDIDLDTIETDLGTIEIDFGTIEIDLGTIEYGCVTTSEELLYITKDIVIMGKGIWLNQKQG